MPVAGMTDAGKSKLLNLLYNIKFLESTSGIGTKFVNLLRYNPKIKQPCFYHLKINKEKDKYIFYKDLSSKIEGEENIIKENMNINNEQKKKLNIVYEDLFYMTEININPFIKDKEFLLKHDLCDIPGLSESQNNQKGNFEEIKNKNIEKKKENEDNFYRKLYGLNLESKDEKDKKIVQINKEKENMDEIFSNLVIEKNTYLTEIFTIIKDYIDGGIIMLTTDNYNMNQNYEIIAKLHLILKKNITNFLIILNKIDLSSTPNEDIESFKGILMQKFSQFKAFNLNLNTFIPLSLIQLENELSMDKSFIHLLNYHFYNYRIKTKIDNKNHELIANKTFINHLKDILCAFKIKKDNIVEKVDELKDEEIIKIDSDIISFLSIIKKEDDKNEINLGFNEYDLESTDNQNSDELLCQEFNEDSKDSIYELNASTILYYFYYCHKKNFLIPPLSMETKKLFGYFKEKQKTIINNSSNPKLNNIDLKTDINEEIIKHLHDLSNQLEKLKLNYEGKRNLIEEIRKLIYFLKIYNVILIPLIGPISAGKTTLINGIIGKDILPTAEHECTKKGIIIGYSDEKEIKISKYDFQKETFLNKTYYYFQKIREIGSGIDKVKETLQGLNKDFPKDEQNCFYYIATKIKLLDELSLNDNLKKMIYFIDFPGFGNNNYYEELIYKIESICNSFFFVVRNLKLNQNDNGILINKIFNHAKKNKNIIDTDCFIKSCVFIVNNDKTQKTSNIDLEEGKQQISMILPAAKKSNINLTFFNAKYYLNYSNHLNYFYDLDTLFGKEYQNYQANNSNIFKNPEKYFSEQNYKTFLTYLKYSLNIKTDKKVKAKQKIDDEVLNKITTISSNNSFIDKNEFEKEKKNLAKLITYGQENTKLVNLNESNIEEFKKIFLEQIKYINNEIQNNFENNINIVMNKLNIFFRVKGEKDIKEEISNLIQNLNNMKEKFKNLLNLEKSEINKILKMNEDKIISLLDEKNKNIIELLEKKNFEEIKKQTYKNVETCLSEIKSPMKEYLNKNISKLNKLIEEVKKILINSTQDKEILSVKDFPTFSKDNIFNIIFKELKSSSDSLFYFLFTNGPIEFLKASFSEKHYLINLIDIIKKNYLKEVNSKLSIFEGQFKEYINEIVDYIEFIVWDFQTNFDEEQKKIFLEIRKVFLDKKKKNT